MDAPKDYDGPGWQDWLFAFVCTLLIGYEVFVARGAEQQQSALSYYVEVPGVRLLQTAGLTVTSAVVGLTLLWILFGRRTVVERALVGLALTGIALCWIEAVRALATQPNPVFVLSELPFRPVNNMGLVGSQVFATYLLLKAPDSRMSPGRSLAVKAGLAVCVWLVQWLVWDSLTRAR